MNTKLTVTHGSVEGSKDALVQDLKSVVVHAEDLLKEVTNSTAEGFAAARTKVEKQLGEARIRLDDARVAVTARAKSAADATQVYVKDNPWKVAGGAAVAGMIIALLLRRR
jgi:ElaB/YqjD/DUF883 family membrane-anchored ribosome-binding protein